MIPRRNLIVSIATALTGLVLGGASRGVFAASRPSPVIQGPELTSFLEVSRYLTGFDDLDQILAGHYATHLKERFGTEWPELLATASHIDNAEGTGSANRLEQTDSAGFPDLARTLVKLWYSGWTQPTPEIPQEIVARSYRHALCWRALGVKPRGMPSGELWQGQEN